MSDLWTVLTFSCSPLPAGDSRIVVRSGKDVPLAVLQLEQWSGSRVGSGGYLWGGSRRLASYLEDHGDGDSGLVPSRSLPTLSLLELGAGTGGVGLVASVLGCRDVTLTDQGSFVYPGEFAAPTGLDAAPPRRTLLDLARRNVQKNLAVLDVPAPVVAELLWGDEEATGALALTSYDIICGGDILLFERSHAALVQTLRRLSNSSTVVLLEHTDRGSDESEYPHDLANFLEAVAEDKLWQPTVIRDHGRHLMIRMVWTEKEPRRVGQAGAQQRTSPPTKLQVELTK